MQELIAEWYALLGGFSAAVAAPLNDLGNGLGVPLVSALLFGLIGATSPCQLTTTAGALAYIARQAGNRRAMAGSALAYVLGKALLYTLIGTAVILAGQQVARSAIPVIIVARKAVGPLMLLLGLYLLGGVPLRFTLGYRLTDWLEARAGTGAGGAFLLGVAFSFTFCPTLFLLFFGLTIPLALRSSTGVVFPAVFALGATLPLLAIAGLLMTGTRAPADSVRRIRRASAWLRPAAAVILLLAGLHDTIVYWVLA